MPWREPLVTTAPAAQFVVYPKTDGWALHAVPEKLASFDNRLDLPEPWAGLSGEALVEATGVPGATFAHPARFYAAAESREAASALARLALEPSACAITFVAM